MKKYIVVVNAAIISIVVIFLAACSSPKPSTAPIGASPSGQLTLTITNPLADSVVDLNNVVISGQTSPEAVVSVNGDLVNVDNNGKFSMPVTLEEGPNAFDIIATDLSGNEASAEVVVAYAP